MVIIAKSKRTNLPPGGGALPSPSLRNVNIAGQRGRNIAAVGSVLHRVNVLAQRANDNAEFEKAVISQQASVNSIIAQNTASIQNPGQYKAQTLENVDKSLNDSANQVGFRNKKRMGVASARIRATAQQSINSQFFKKTADLSNAQYTVSSGELLNKYLEGNITKDEAINTTTVLMRDRFNNGIWDAERTIKEERDFRGRVEKIDFVRTYELDPQGAVDVINNSKFLTTEQKTDFLFKMASKIDKAEKKNSVVLESQAKIKVSKYDRLSLEGKLIPGFVSEDGLSIESLNNDADNGTVGASDLRRILKQQRDIFDAGGIGDERATNALLANIDDDFSVTDDTIDNNTDFNNVQRIRLKNAIETRDNQAISNPISAGYRRNIQRAHKATGIFGSSLLEKEISDHLASSHDLFRAFLLQGKSPEVAFKEMEQVVGPVPGSTDVSDSGLASLKSELVTFDKSAQDENKAKKGKIDESRLRDLGFRRQSLINDIEVMEQQLKTKKFLEELSKNASTGK